MRTRSVAIGLAAALLAALFSGAQAPAAAAAAAAPAPQAQAPADDATVLYSQSGDYGSNVVTSETSPGGSSSIAADDFTVAAADGWTVTQFTFAIYYSLGMPGNAQLTYNVNVYADAAGLPDDHDGPLCSVQEAQGTLDNTTSPFANVTVALPVPCLLPQGTYWVALQGHFDQDTSLPFAPLLSLRTYTADPLPGRSAVWESSAQPGCTSWTPLVQCSDTGNALGFEVIGTPGGGDGNGLDFKVTVAPDNGDPTQCGTQTQISATVGDALNLCYTVTNHSGAPFAFHTLADSQAGTLFSLRPYDLEDGQSYRFNRIVTAELADNGYITAAWTANGPSLGGYDADTSGPSRFVDITATGAVLDDIGDDGSRVVDLPFPVTFYGVTTSTIGVSNNGAIIVGTTRPVNSTNTALPNSGAVLDQPAMFPLWDDFAATSGGVYYGSVGDAPNRTFIVEWYQRPHAPGDQNTDTATFEVVFDEAAGSFSYEYADVEYTAAGTTPALCNGGACATIGLEQDDAHYTQFSFDTASISDGTSILWQPRVATPVTSTAAVRLVVGAPQISVGPGALIGSAAQGATTTASLTIGNTGNRDLTWSIDAAARDAADARAHFPRVPYRAPAANAADVAQRTSVVPFAGGPNSAAHARLPASITSALAPFDAASVPAFAMGGYGPDGGLHPNSVVYWSLDAANPSQLQGLVGMPFDTLVGGAFVDNDFSKEYVVSRGGALYTYDTSTGVSNFVGSVGVAGNWVGDLAWDPATHTLYETVWVPGGNTSYLYTIDTASGSATQVAEVDGVLLVSAAFDTTGHMYGIDVTGSQLIAIDKRNGEWQGIGPLGFYASATANIDFDPRTGVLWMAAHPYSNPALDPVPAIYTVDTANGRAHEVALVAQSVDLTALALAAPYEGCSDPATIPWLAVTPGSGTLTSGSSVQLTATFNAATLTAGDYSAQLCVRSDDLSNRIVSVPVHFTVTGTSNPPPVAHDDAYTTTAGAALTVAAPGVLANDSGASGATLTASLVAAPAHGTLALSADGGFIYLAAAGFVGNDSFAYTVNDGHADSAAATVTISVQSSNAGDTLFKDGFDGSAP